MQRPFSGSQGKAFTPHQACACAANLVNSRPWYSNKKAGHESTPCRARAAEKRPAEQSAGLSPDAALGARQGSFHDGSHDPPYGAV